MLELKLKNESQTLRLGCAIGETIKNLNSKNFEVHLRGNLGAGKTEFCRAIIHALGYVEDVPSPTFTLVQTYEPPVDNIDMFESVIEFFVDHQNLHKLQEFDFSLASF